MYRTVLLAKSCIAIWTSGEIVALGLSPSLDDTSLLKSMQQHPDVYQRGIQRGKAFKRHNAQVARQEKERV